MQPRFRTDRYGFIQPDIRPIKESGECYVLYQPFQFRWGDDTVTVPEGFRLDGASVPHVLWSVFFAKDGMHRAASLIHDYLYDCKGVLPEGIIYARKNADDLFKDSLKIFGIKHWQISAAYKAVRLFGEKAWKN